MLLKLILVRHCAHNSLKKQTLGLLMCDFFYRSDGPPVAHQITACPLSIVIMTQIRALVFLAMVLVAEH